ncbi:hypothetical protein BGZ94_001221 [Podila epigama]|nr:hypothetical protein BGZ94_001221 [Podila epigama]
MDVQLRKTGVLTLLSALASLTPALGNVVFNKFPDTTVVQPGSTVVLRWTHVVAPPAGTAVNNEPFILLLRALSGQSYVIQRDVPQDLLTLSVVVPSIATGGKHSFRADYAGAGGISSNQFNITGNIITTTSISPPTATTTTNAATPGVTNPVTPDANDGKESSGGLSGAALGGIVGGVVALLMFLAFIFFFRKRRLARERNEHSRTGDSKENHGHLTSRDDRSMPMTTRSMGSPGGPNGPNNPPPPPGQNISVPLSVAPSSYEKQHSSRDDYNGHPSSPQSPRHMQHPGQQQHQPPQQHQQPHQGDRNPFGGDDRGPAPLSPRPQHQQYEPPQMSSPPPRPYQQGQQGSPYQQPYALPPFQQNQQNQHQRGQSPFQDNRQSLESEVESAYDPRAQNMNHAGGPAPMMRGGPPMANGNLRHSPSGRSLMSDPRQRQMASPTQQNYHQQQQQQQHHHQGGNDGGPFQDHQPGSMSPPQSHRPKTPNQQQQQQQYPQDHDGRSQNNMPRNREIEMQPLDIQQHQYEQQQRVLQRQQQQQEQQAAPPVAPAASAASVPAPPQPQPSPFNPTHYDDKTEIDDDGVPVYNGYRDTIFGAYVHNKDDDDEDEDASDDGAKAIPAVPAPAVAYAGHQPTGAVDGSHANENGTGVQRKKSVKFTGVPASGPIVTPAGQGTAYGHQPPPQKALDAVDDEHLDDEDEDGYYEDEDDIKQRLMEKEVPSPTVSNASAHQRPVYINTSTGSPAVSHQAAVLSPVRSVASPTSPRQQQQPKNVSSPSLVSGPVFGNGFYEDVIAAVDKSSGNIIHDGPSSPRQQQQQQQQLPILPSPVPRSPEPSHHHLQQQQQQHLPPPQGPMLQTKEVFGAPSPRIAPAVVNQHHHIQSQGLRHPPSPSLATSTAKPVPSPRQQIRDDEESAFYESSLL